MLRHLLELRRRTLQIITFFLVVFTVLFLCAPNLFHTLMWPLIAALPANDSLIATQITTPLLTPIKLAADAALLMTAPFALFHAWQFASPGLYRDEKHHLRWVIVSSIVLFGVGCIFCFYLVLPFMFQMFVHAVPMGVRLMPDMAYTVDFITRMLLIFGLCFQLPLLCWLLVHLRLLNLATLKQARPYVLVAAFTLGMLLTPPDVLSQILLAIPLYLLYEAGVFLARFLAKK